MKHLLRDAAIFLGAAALTFTISYARSQTMCQNLGGGFTSCSNGTSSQRLDDFDFNSDGSWGMRLGGGMYLANPPANPQPEAPQYPPNDTQRRPYEPSWPGKRPAYR